MPRTTLLRKQVTQTGTIQPHAGGAAPEGYLVCDGTIVNIADYPKLFAVIGTSWGYGNNDGLTFHLPDLRGRFLRGVDDAAGRDPDAGARTPANAGGNSGDAVGSVQDDANKADFPTPFSAQGYPNNDSRGTAAMFRDTIDSTTGNRVEFGGPEARPKNANVTYVIKVV